MNASMKSTPATMPLTALSGTVEDEIANSSSGGSRLLQTSKAKADETAASTFMAAEQFRYMQRKLTQIMPNGGVVLLSSAVQGEGKSFNACNLAYALAEAGNSTLLLDLDLRRPAQVRELVLDDGRLLDVLAGKKQPADVAVRMPGVPLSVLGTRDAVAEPVDLLRSAGLANTIAWARKNVRWTIVDGPPVLPLADSEELLLHVDLVLLVARERVTPTGALKRAMERLGERLNFVIYNDAAPVEAYGYGYSAYEEPRHER